jgi:hypothetical protein
MRKHMETVHMRSPEGEVKEVEATTETLTPLMVAGWHQVPAPTVKPEPIVQKPVAPAMEEK